jgi:CRP-like cAMP-binding protein
MQRAEAERIALAGGWLARQPPVFRAAVLARALLQPFATGAFTYHTGDAPGGIYGVVAGGFAVLAAGRHAGPDLAHIVRPPVWFGHGPVLSGGPRTLSFRAAEPSLTLHVPLAALEDLSSTMPAAPRAIGAITDDSVRIAAEIVSDLLIREPDRRIAATLLRATGASDGAVPDAAAGFRLTQSELGEMANASRHLVNRTLGAFAARGWVTVGYGRIAVQDATALAAFARERG